MYAMPRSHNLRLTLLAALAPASLSAFGADAYSNITGPYAPSSYAVDRIQSIGYRFTSSLSGEVSSFTVAMGNGSSETRPLAYTLSLYADDGGRLGTLLGFYDGLSNGEAYGGASTYSVVAASGVSLTSGSDYWLVATSDNELVWYNPDRFMTQWGYIDQGGDEGYREIQSGAFSVQVVPEPASIAACGLGALGLLHRRRRERS